MKRSVKLFSIALSLFLVFSSGSCKKENESSKTKYDNSTQTAQVTKIEGNQVTLVLGNLPNDESGAFPEGQPPQRPEDMSGAFPEGQPPQRPEDMSGEFPEGMPPQRPEDMSGEFPEGMPPQRPEDMSGEFPEAMPPQRPEDMSGAFPEGQPPQNENIPPMFPEGNDTLTLNLNAEVVKTLSVGDLVKITFGENGAVLSIDKIPLQNGWASFHFS